MFNICKRKAPDCASATCNSEPTGETTIYEYTMKRNVWKVGEKTSGWCDGAKLQKSLSQWIQKLKNYFF